MKRKLDYMSIAGLVLAFGLMVIGIVLTKNTAEDGNITYTWLSINLRSFYDLTSVFIVVGGTIASLMVSFPLELFKKVPKHLKIVFLPRKYVPEEYIATLVDCAKKARISGLLALEEDVASIQDAFLKNSLQLIVDSIDPEKVKVQMEMWIQSAEERHLQEAAFYDKGAQLAPAFGMVGTLIGLINMLKNLSDVETIGPNMAVALVTTFYGSILANVIFAPIANKLRARHEEEYLCMQIVYEGIQSIQSGENPKLIQEKLFHLLPEYRQQGLAGVDKNAQASEEPGNTGRRGRKQRTGRE